VRPDDYDGRSFWPLFLLLIAAAAILIVLQMRRPRMVEPMVQRPLPPLDAAGWLNADRPLTMADLRGKVVLVNFWATDCPACVAQTPELVTYHERFRDQGVLVIGLTHESDEPFGQVTRYVEGVEGMDWPVGYGAELAFSMLDIYGTPTYILYDRAGKSVWGGHSLDGLEDATIAALAKE
jgi:thiol-disulfide isomerase/thioredoxin